MKKFRSIVVSSVAASLLVVGLSACEKKEGPAERAGAHLPEAARGNLAPMDEMKARRLRAQLVRKLNR